MNSLELEYVIKHYGVKGMRWGYSMGRKSDALGRYRRGASKKTKGNIDHAARTREAFASKLPSPFDRTATSVSKAMERGDNAVNNWLSTGNRRMAINVVAGAATVALLLKDR